MTAGLVIRAATLKDAAAMSALSLGSMHLIESDGALPESLLESFSPAAFSARISQGEYASFVAQCQGAMAGFVTFKGDDYLYHLFVDEAYHRQGVARMLWQHALESSSAQVIRLRSSLYAVPVYKKLGFALDGAPSSFDSYQFQPMCWVRQGSAKI